MNYSLMPSLEHMALIKIAISLFNQDDIRYLIAKPYSSVSLRGQREEKWKELEDKVKEKLLQLPLPKRLKKEILGFIKPITYELLKLKHDNFYFDIYLGVDLSNKLCWTPEGTVNEKETAKVLINDEKLDITTRYKLACIYCLENDILELWNRIPESDRNSFYIKEDSIDGSLLDLVVIWTYIITGEVDKLDNIIERIMLRRCSPYEYAFIQALADGNKAATEYFLQKLTSREREESLIRSTIDVVNRRRVSWFWNLPKHYAEVLCFLLSQMDEEQQMEVFKSCPYNVLTSLLNWPFQSFFMETANRMWEFLPKYQYDILLRTIVDQVINGYKDCNYQQLFGEFWKQCPDANKRYVLGNYSSAEFLLLKLFHIEDEENVILILKNATVKEKEEIFYRTNICEELIYGGNWDLLKFCVQECISSKEAMIKFIEKLKLCLSKIELGSEKWDKCLNFLDKLIHKYNKKRSMEEGECNPAKKLNIAQDEKVTYSIKK